MWPFVPGGCAFVSKCRVLHASCFIIFKCVCISAAPHKGWYLIFQEVNKSVEQSQKPLTASLQPTPRAQRPTTSSEDFNALMTMFWVLVFRFASYANCPLRNCAGQPNFVLSAGSHNIFEQLCSFAAWLGILQLRRFWCLFHPSKICCCFVSLVLCWSVWYSSHCFL